MKYIVSVRVMNTTTQFSFDSELERKHFIENLKKEDPSAEFVCSVVNTESFFYSVTQGT